ncbi:hypothetical protein [Pulveribacter sp.]|uniref:hypothetical protein n=1 Tax=Pulveribacter sp. TaxID=2678893 RepID=UPI0028AE75A5|nr:hypothetical protein [Pulveribacter sp.]
MAGASAFASPQAGPSASPAGQCSAMQHHYGIEDLKAGTAADLAADLAADAAADCGIDLPDDQEFQRPVPDARGTHFPCPQLRTPLLASRTPPRRLRPPRA